MNREELDRKLDEWVDRAVAERGRVEIRSGFETRVIANLMSRFGKRTWRFRMWVPVAMTAAAVLFITIYAVRTQYWDRPAEIVSERPREMKLAPKQSIQKESLAQKAAVELPLKEEVKVLPPKTETGNGHFLSSGLSDRERRLIKFVSEFSETAVAETPETAEFKPIEIPATKIQEFEIQEFEIMSFTIEPFNLSTSGNEEPL